MRFGGVTVFTIGHSTRTIEAFVDLATAAGVAEIVDVRSIPRSRTNPQFNPEAFTASLAQVGLGYRHLAALGGLRHHPRGAPPSPNTLWRNTSFRNYADYATTAAFGSGLEQLRTIAAQTCCAIMCAEVLWWRCHRRIIADYLLVGGATVFHIMGPGKIEPAQLTKGAWPKPDGTILYPAP